MLVAFKKRPNLNVSLNELFIVIGVSFLFFGLSIFATWDSYSEVIYYHPAKATIIRLFPHNMELQYQVSGIQYLGTHGRDIESATVNSNVDIFYDIRNPSTYDDGNPYLQFQGWRTMAAVWLVVSTSTLVIAFRQMWRRN